MQLINYIQDWDTFITDYSDCNWVLIPAYINEEQHPKHQQFCLWYIYCIEVNMKFVANFSNLEIDSKLKISDITLPTKNKIFLYNKKHFLYQFLEQTNFIDLGLLQFFQTNKNEKCRELNDSVIARKFKQLYPNLKSVINLLPVTKIVEWCEYIFDTYSEYFGSELDSGFHQYNSKTLVELQKIENSGLYTNEEIFAFQKSLIHNNLVYTEYNIYTTTGRPSNKHSNVNYAALNKNTNARKSFISRFGKEDGKLVSFDYDAYHLRLLADLVNYTFPENISVHTYLGKQYFNISENNQLTEFQYAESKTISFQKLYGGIDVPTLKIPFFKAVHEYTYKLWAKWKTDGFVETPTFKRLIKQEFFTDSDNLTPPKLLNYLLQAQETERNIEIIEKLNNLLLDCESKLVLYTYDSFLFDFKLQEKPILTEIYKIVNSEKFPVKIETGNDYMNLKEIVKKKK